MVFVDLTKTNKSLYIALRKNDFALSNDGDCENTSLRREDKLHLFYTPNTPAITSEPLQYKLESTIVI